MIANAVDCSLSTTRARGTTVEPLPHLRPMSGALSGFVGFGRTLGGCTPTSGVPHRRFHASMTKVLSRIPLIMSSATEPKILNRALAAHRPRVHVVEL